MRTINKKALSIFLACILVIAAFPFPAAAADEKERIEIDLSTVSNRIEIYSTYYTIDSGSQITYNPQTQMLVLTGTGAGSRIYLYDADLTITLKDVTVSSQSQALYTPSSATNITIILEGDNTLSGGNSMGEDFPAINVSSEGSVTIEGAGNLSATGYGKAAGGGGSYLLGDSNRGKMGGTVIINSGNVTVNGGSDGGYAIGTNSEGTNAGTLIVNGGTLTMGDATNPLGFGGPTGTGTFTVNGGSVSIVGQTAPSITSVSPAAGNAAGGTVVTLTGSDFTADTVVRFGGVLATAVNFVSDTEITCTTPAGAEGMVDVSVLDIATGASTLADGFKYDDTKPTVSSVSSSGSIATVAVKFDESMDTSVIGAVSLNGTALTGTGTWSKTTFNNDTYTIAYSGLNYSTTYTVDVSGFKDLAGNEMDAVTGHTFTTAAQGQSPTTPVDTGSSGVIYTQRTLTDTPTGVRVSGSGIASTSRLTVSGGTGSTGLSALHAEGSCAACDEIRARQAAGEVIVLYDISLTTGHSGPVDVYIPFSGTDGSLHTVLHCNKGVLEQRTGWYADGGVTTTWARISPFAVLKAQEVSVPDDIVVEPPKTGDVSTPLGFLLLCAGFAGIVAVRIVRKKKA